MYSQSKEFFLFMVEPTVEEFFKSPLDIRRGLLAAVVLNHMTDHTALQHCTSTDKSVMDALIKETRSKMFVLSPDFQFIQDIADVTKHAKLCISKKTNRAPRDILSSQQISSCMGLFAAPFGEGVFSEAAFVFAKLADGTERPLLPAIKKVLSLWRSEISP